MEWLFKPKVQLGLLVNFAFIMFTLVSSSARVAAPARLRPAATYYDPPAVPYAPLPPPAVPSSSATTESDGRLNVFLNNDLTLVKKAGRTLVLSPSFITRGRPPEPPPAVTLRFTIFADKDACPGACMLVINADASHVWESAAKGTFSTGWTREKIPGSTIKLPDGQTAETLAAEILTTRIPYGTFVEIISARRVVLSFGPDKVELTHDQIEAMRDMQRRVAPQPAEGHKPGIIKAF
jgi:hypothetical protein